MNFRNCRQLCVTVAGAALDFYIEACAALKGQQEKLTVSDTASEIRHILGQSLAARVSDIAVEHRFLCIFSGALIHEKCLFKLTSACLFKSLNDFKGLIKILAEANRTVVCHKKSIAARIVFIFLFYCVSQLIR